MRQEKSKKQVMYHELDSQLAHNNLIRKTISEGPRSLFRSLADLLLFNQPRHQQLLQQCRSHLDDCLVSHRLPPKLQYFYQHAQLSETYKQHPQMPNFDRVHLQLLSHKFQTQIVLYYLSPDLYLSGIIFNNNYSKCTRICKVLNHYDPVYSHLSLELANEFKDLIVEKLMAKSKPDDHNIEPNTPTAKPPVKRKHKKSLSVCDEQEYKEFQYIKKSDHFGDDMEDFKHIKENPSERMERKGSTSLDKDPTVKSLHGHEMPYSQSQLPYIPMVRSHFSSDYRMIQSQRNFPLSVSPTKLEEPNRRYTGRLKFFDQIKNYGFIVMDEDCSDIFVHYDDLQKANIDKDFMRSTKHGNIIRFEFTCMVYIGKYNRSRKAVDLVLITSPGFVPF